jgi:hypothetical protein
VNATEFSPLTLEQLSKSQTFAVLLCYYLFAILVNMLFVETFITAATLPVIPNTWTVPFVPNSWNVSLGVGAGLTAMSLLSLLVVRQLLVQLTSPEHLLSKTAQDVTVKSLSSASGAESGSDISQPQRTPLLTIERILESADLRGDEYTVQSAIYETHKAIVGLINSTEIDLSSQNSGNEQTLSSDEFSILIDRWETCLEKGEDGPTRRRHLVAQYHREILVALMMADECESVETNLNGLTRLCTAGYQDGSTDPTLLLEFEPIFATGIDLDMVSVLRQVETELSTVSGCILRSSNSEHFQDGQRELLSTVLKMRVEHLATVTTTDEIDTHTGRNYAETTLNQLNRTIEDCISLLEEIESGAAIKQNILTDLHRTLMPAVHDCAPAEPIITRQLLIAFLELSVTLDRDHSEVIDSLYQAGDSDGDIKNQLEGLGKSNLSPEITALNVPEDEIHSLIDFAVQYERADGSA